MAYYANPDRAVQILWLFFGFILLSGAFAGGLLVASCADNRAGTAKLPVEQPPARPPLMREVESDYSWTKFRDDREGVTCYRDSINYSIGCVRDPVQAK